MRRSRVLTTPAIQLLRIPLTANSLVAEQRLVGTLERQLATNVDYDPKLIVRQLGHCRANTKGKNVTLSEPHPSA